MNQMTTIYEYFERVEFDYQSEENLIQILRRAIDNSKRKLYHGHVEKEYSLQQYQKKLEARLTGETSILHYYDPKTLKMANEDDDDFLERACVRKASMDTRMCGEVRIPCKDGI